MTFAYVTDPVAADWDARIAANPDGGTMFQTAELAEIKKVGRWRPRYAECEGIALTIHEKDAPGFGKVWYLPKGPGVATTSQLVHLMPQLAQAGREAGAFMMRIEPELPRSEDLAATLRAGGMVQVPPVQPNASTIVMDLSGSIDDVFARINKKRRYDIRRAERDGVVAGLAEPTDENLHTMYELWEGVVADHQLALRGEDYYTRFWRTFLDAGMGALFLAHYEGRAVAGAFAVVLGEKSTYKDGASVRDRPVQGASHLLQWRVMEWAHERGAKAHDLCGTPPSDQMDNTEHQYYGLGQFKRGFNAEVTDFTGAWDLPLALGKYKLWQRIGARVVTKLQSQGRGDGFY